jgi:hypothetical protein
MRFREFGGVLMAARKRVVGEGGVRADEDIVFKGDAIPELYTAFNGDTVAYSYFVLDEHVVADVTFTADYGPREDVGEGPHAGSPPDVICFNQCLWVFVVVLLLHDQVSQKIKL